ncbi:hypothetical protein [Rosistilla oblonga]|uniref:hypothetical protein n=1 Tax=Rosistilla oblonga TaxID=2527990 RepID=UPI003A988447
MRRLPFIESLLNAFLCSIKIWSIVIAKKFTAAAARSTRAIATLSLLRLQGGCDCLFRRNARRLWHVAREPRFGVDASATLRPLAVARFALPTITLGVPDSRENLHELWRSFCDRACHF